MNVVYAALPRDTHWHRVDTRDTPNGPALCNTKPTNNDQWQLHEPTRHRQQCLSCASIESRLRDREALLQDIDWDRGYGLDADL